MIATKEAIDQISGLSLQARLIMQKDRKERK